MTNLEKILKKYCKFILPIIFVLAIIIRWWFLPARNINFGYDQSRDAFVVREILSGHLKILGPPTSGTPGLFHGVLFYYIIAPAYFFGHGDPLIVAYWMSFISSLAVFPVFYLAYLLTGKRLPSLLSAIVFAVSLDAIQFSDFISNVTLGILFVPFIYIGVYLWIKKAYKWAPLLTGLAFGLSVQSEVAFCFYLVPIIFWLIATKKKLTFKDVLLFIGAFVFATSTMIVAELKFGFPAIKGLLYLFSSKDMTAGSMHFSEFVSIFINQIGERFANTLFPFNIVFGSLVGFGVAIYTLIKGFINNGKKIFTWQNFLLSYIPAHIIALPFGGSITPYIMIGAIPAISILIGIFIYECFEKKKIFIVICIVFLAAINLVKFISNQKTRPDYFTNDYILSREMSIVDYTYISSGEKPFSISTLTSPLFINTLWSYLYNWYGEGKYGYLPYWVGRDQIGQVGNDLVSPPNGVLEHFFIAEPANYIPPIYATYAYGDQNSISKIINEKKFGNMVVQERSLINNGKQR